MTWLDALLTIAAGWFALRAQRSAQAAAEAVAAKKLAADLWRGSEEGR